MGILSKVPLGHLSICKGKQQARNPVPSPPPASFRRFIVPERLNQLRGFGGVRIEDDVIVREHGAELMSIVPR
jgi:hypothetical protein